MGTTLETDATHQEDHEHHLKIDYKTVSAHDFYDRLLRVHERLGGKPIVLKSEKDNKIISAREVDGDFIGTHTSSQETGEGTFTVIQQIHFRKNPDTEEVVFGSKVITGMGNMPEPEIDTDPDHLHGTEYDRLNVWLFLATAEHNLDRRDRIKPKLTLHFDH